MKIQPHKSSIGMDANVWAMLVYIITIILGWIPYVNFAAWVFPLVIYMTEKESDFVRFHAVQAVAVYIINAIVSILFTIITAAVAASMVWNPFGAFGAAGGIVAVNAISGIIHVLIMVFTILALAKAYQYEEYRIPVIGGFADKLAAIVKRAA